MALVETTLAAAVTAGSRDIFLTTNSGVAVGDICFIEREGMKVTGLFANGSTQVTRGFFGYAVAHVSGVTARIGGRQYFTSADPTGVAVGATPLVNVQNGRVWEPGSDGSWSLTEESGLPSSGGSFTWASVPASASAAGTAGDMAYESGYLYVCVATNTWQRAVLATW